MLKRRKYLICLLFLTLFLPHYAHSQAPPEPDPLYGVITFVAEEGEFLALDEDDVYELVLEEVPGSAPYWLDQPGFMPLPPEIIGSTPVSDNSAVGLILVASMINAWLQDDELTGDAWLATRNTLVHMEIRLPDYYPDTDTLIFEATVLEIIGGDQSKGLPIVPDSFREASLSLTLEPDLIMGLDIGIANAIEGVAWRCSGTARQLAICECKREADIEMDTRADRVAAYAQCNLIPPEADGAPQKK